MAAIDTIYNYYLSTYGSSSANRYDIHKKSELRTIYNNMVKLNKESPLIKIKESEDIHKFIIDVKESARSLEKVAVSLSDDSNNLFSAFKKRIAISSQEEIASASYVGEDASGSDLTAHFNLSVKRLASPQVNIGFFLAKTEHSVPEGKYTFDLNNNSTGYEFQYTVFSGDTNYSVQDKIVKLVNSANIGINAELIQDESGNSSLKLSSRDTGLNEDESFLFQILPGTSKESQNAMGILGFDHVSKEAESSRFSLNGVERSSLSNTFTINKEFEVTLKGITEEESPASIGFKNDVDAITENLQSLVDAYNQVVQISNNYASSNQHSSKLRYEITSVAASYKNELDSMGLTMGEGGSIRIDRALLEEAIASDYAEEGLEDLNNFKNSLRVCSSRISLNPISYANKIIIAYKNPGRNFNAPYISSMYSGMLLDRCC